MAADEKKPIRSVLTGVEMFWMVLMPVSNFATIALVSLCAAGYVDLLHACAAIAAFYVLWALRNKIFGGNKLEKGHLTYGTVLAGALARNYALALVGVALVAGSILYVLRVILPWPLSKLAHGERRRYFAAQFWRNSLTACHHLTVRNKTKSHAAIFKTYLVLMLASLVVLAVLLARERGPGLG